jgi:hypothetical protein
MYGAETCRSGINILNTLFTSHSILLGLSHFNFKKCMVQATKKKIKINFVYIHVSMTVSHTTLEAYYVMKQKRLGRNCGIFC